MARNEISRLTITIDIDKATGKIISFNQKIGEAERKVQSAGRAMDRTASSAQNMGDRAAAGAVGFQTMAQGMLNVTTSAAQTFTSFTNLASAEHRVAQAHIGVARAQDLLNAKQLRYDELVAAGNQNTQKAINLANELSTAEADLIAKKEKLRIEQSKMNDVYILFGVNLLNVAVSLGTTIAAMKASRAAAAAVNAQMVQNNATMRQGTMVSKIHTMATWSGVRAKYQEISAIRTSNAVLPVNFRLMGMNTKALGFTTTATRLLSGAVRGLNLAFGPLGLAMMGISLAIGFLMPELEKLGRDFFGMSDALHDVESQLGGTTDAINEQTHALDSLSESANKNTNDALPFMIAMQNSYMRQIQGTTTAIKEQIQANKDLGVSRQGFSTPSASTAGGTRIGTEVSTGTPSGYQSGTTASPVISDSQKVSRGKLAPKTIAEIPKVIEQQLDSLPYRDIYGGLKFAPRPDPLDLGFGTFGNVVDEFEKNKQNMESEIDVLQKKVQSGTISTSEIDRLQILNYQYMTNYQNKTIDRFTGKTITATGISQSQMMEEWSKGLPFKFDPSKTTTTQDFREAAGYTIPEKEKQKQENLWVTMYERGGSQRDFVLNMIEGRFAQKFQSFDFGTNIGYGVPFYDQYGNIDPNALLGRGNMIRALNVGTKGMSDELVKILGLKTVEEQQPQLLGTAFQKAQARAEEIRLQEFIRTYDMDTSRSIEGVTGQGGVSSYAVVGGKVETYVSSRARQAMAAAQQLGRMTWYKEQAASKTSASGGVNILHFLPTDPGVTAEDREAFKNLARSHSEQVKIEADKAYERGSPSDIGWLRQNGINNAKALAATIMARIRAEKLKAGEFATSLRISQQEALTILRDKAQGEQTLLDMLAYQQRLDAMSSGVI